MRKLGGRGSSSGVSKDKKPYGTEYTTLFKEGNIKFVRYNDSKSAKAPMETRRKGRVYVTVNNQNKPSTITYYDRTGKRTKSIDLLHPHNGIKEPHAHHGYNHDENGTTRLTLKERKMVESIQKLWHNKNSEQ